MPQSGNPMDANDPQQQQPLPIADSSPAPEGGDPSAPASPAAKPSDADELSRFDQHPRFQELITFKNTATEQLEGLTKEREEMRRELNEAYNVISTHLAGFQANQQATADPQTAKTQYTEQFIQDPEKITRETARAEAEQVNAVGSQQLQGMQSQVEIMGLRQEFSDYGDFEEDIKTLFSQYSGYDRVPGAQRFAYLIAKGMKADDLVKTARESGLSEEEIRKQANEGAVVETGGGAARGEAEVLDDEERAFLQRINPDEDVQAVFDRALKWRKHDNFGREIKST